MYNDNLKSDLVNECATNLLAVEIKLTKIGSKVSKDVNQRWNLILFSPIIPCQSYRCVILPVCLPKLKFKHFEIRLFHITSIVLLIPGMQGYFYVPYKKNNSRENREILPAIFQSWNSIILNQIVP